MDSGVSYAIMNDDIVLVAVLSAAVLTAALVVVRQLARRSSWSTHKATSLTWSVSLGSVAVLGLVLVVTGRTFGQHAALVVEGDRVSPTLVWLPCVLALLWSVLHALRGGAGRAPALLDLPVAVAVGALWLVSLPLQVTVFTVGLLGPLTWVGLVLWLVGQAVVATGRAVVGDVAVWTGIALVAADAWPGYVGLVSPVVVALLAARSWRRGEGRRESLVRPLS